MRHEWFSTAQLRGMLRSGTIADGHSVAAWALFELHRQSG